MKNIITILIFAFALGLGAQQIQAKAAPEKAVAVFKLTPRMTCSNCENKIKSNLRFEKGVSEIVTDLRSADRDHQIQRCQNRHRSTAESIP